MKAQIKDLIPTQNGHSDLIFDVVATPAEIDGAKYVVPPMLEALGEMGISVEDGKEAARFARISVGVYGIVRDGIQGNDLQKAIALILAEVS